MLCNNTKLIMAVQNRSGPNGPNHVRLIFPVLTEKWIHFGPHKVFPSKKFIWIRIFWHACLLFHFRHKAEYLKSLKTEQDIVIHAAYGSSKDINVYSSLGLKSEQIFIIGKPSRRQNSLQVSWISNGYVLGHLLYRHRGAPMSRFDLLNITALVEIDLSWIYILLASYRVCKRSRHDRIYKLYVVHREAYVLGQAFWVVSLISGTLGEFFFHKMKPIKCATIFKNTFWYRYKTIACTPTLRVK